MFVNLPIRPSLIATWSQRWVAGHESWPLAREGSDSGVTLGPPKLAVIGVSRNDFGHCLKSIQTQVRWFWKIHYFWCNFAWFTKMVSGFVSTAFMQHSQTQIRPWFSWVFPWKEQLSWNHFSAHTLMGENETPLNLWHLRSEMLRCWWSVKMVCHFDWSRPVVFSQFCASKSSWHVRYAGKTIIAWKGLAMLLPCFIARVPKKLALRQTTKSSVGWKSWTSLMVLSYFNPHHDSWHFWPKFQHKSAGLSAGKAGKTPVN